LKNGSHNLEYMTYHLTQYIKYHGDTCKRPRHSLLADEADDSGLYRQPLNFRLVDVKRLQVVSAPIANRCAALSYLWDLASQSHIDGCTKASFEVRRGPGGLPVHRLPRTIADAIEVCGRIARRYL
jgi:hypothetical protein